VGDIKAELIDMSEYVFTARIRPGLESLTDDEYFWEPVAGCWSLRSDPDGRYFADGTPLPTPGDPPFTTVAWRLWHVTQNYGLSRTAPWLGIAPHEYAFDMSDPAPPTAAAALDALDTAYAWWAGALRALDADRWAEPMGAVAGPYAESTRASYVTHQLDEVIHHSAEVSLVRDLYRVQVASPPQAPASLADAAAGGHWAEVRRRANAGEDVDTGRPDDNDRRPAHYAASGAPLDVLRLLVDRGADLTVRDAQFNLTPRGWAKYFNRDDAAELLRG